MKPDVWSLKNGGDQWKARQRRYFLWPRDFAVPDMSLRLPKRHPADACATCYEIPLMSGEVWRNIRRAPAEWGVRDYLRKLHGGFHVPMNHCNYVPDSYRIYTRYQRFSPALQSHSKRLPKKRWLNLKMPKPVLERAGRFAFWQTNQCQALSGMTERSHRWETACKWGDAGGLHSLLSLSRKAALWAATTTTRPGSRNHHSWFL